MLPVCLGEASKTAAFMLAAGKRYRATAKLGEATTTGDVEGQVIKECPLPGVDSTSLARSLNKFIGRIEQVPPMYSALKYQGKPLYEYARAGIEIDRPARTVNIHQLDLVEWKSPYLTFDVHCSKGTYIRTLAEDIATAMDSCAHLVVLRRIHVEPFEDYPMHTLEQLQEALDQGELQSFLLPVDVGITDWPRVDVDSVQVGKFKHGNQFLFSADPQVVGKVRVYSSSDELLGLADLSDDGVLRPSRVFNL
jgi:tRNA pseudouridine55 synthase